MSVNENMEFAAINQKTGERAATAQAACCSTEELYRASRAKKTKRAALCMVAILLGVIAAMLGFTGLEMIGWINDTFCIVLKCFAGCVAMFYQGYFWCKIKN